MWSQYLEALASIDVLVIPLSAAKGQVQHLRLTCREAPPQVRTPEGQAALVLS